MRAELTVVIARTPDDVFGFLTDVANLPLWQAGVRRAEIEGGGGPVVGARIREARTILGRELETTLEITEVDPPRTFVLRTLDGPVPFTVRHVLEPDGEGTRLSVAGEADTGLLPGFAAGLMARRAEKQFRKDFERLKERLEGAG